MQEAALGNKRTGINERDRGLHPILTDAELPDKLSVQREEVPKVAAPTPIGALAPRRIGEVAKASVVHCLMHAVQLGSQRTPQLPSARWRPVEVLVRGFHDPVRSILQRAEKQILDRALTHRWHRAQAQDL